MAVQFVLTKKNDHQLTKDNTSLIYRPRDPISCALMLTIIFFVLILVISHVSEIGAVVRSQQSAMSSEPKSINPDINLYFSMKLKQMPPASLNVTPCDCYNFNTTQGYYVDCHQEEKDEYNLYISSDHNIKMNAFQNFIFEFSPQAADLTNCTKYMTDIANISVVGTKVSGEYYFHRHFENIKF